MGDQRNESFVEPSREEIVAISKYHVAALEKSDSDDVWILAGMAHVLLRTIGRRSGNEHKVALPYWLDPAGERVVVGSFAGAPTHPSWYLNLTDRVANPEVYCRVQGEQFWADAQILEGADYARTWAGLTADRAYYDAYTLRTERQIPLVRLHKLRPAEGV